MSKSNALAMVDLFFSQSTTMHNIIHIQCHVYFHFTYFTFAFRLLLFLVECFLYNLQLDQIQYWLIFSYHNVRRLFLKAVCLGLAVKRGFLISQRRLCFSLGLFVTVLV